MSLSCYCGESDWYYLPPEDFVILETTRRKRCCSCKELINIGSEVIRLERWRNPVTDIEERIEGTEVYMAPVFLCEKCGEQFLNLVAYGYCINPMDNMFELLAEHRERKGA